MAELSTNVTDPAIDFTVVFDKMHTSVGQGYSSHSGRFTAPFSGVYSFNLVASSPTKTDTDWVNCKDYNRIDSFETEKHCRKGIFKPFDIFETFG
jgi:hypothetical protein